MTPYQSSGPERPDRLIWVVALVSLAVSGTWFCLFPMQVWYDSSSYLQYANAIWNGTLSTAPDHRSAGYPLFLIVTGVPALGTLWVLLWAQLAMAVYMPVLIYLILRPLNRSVAAATALFSLPTLTTLFYAKAIASEQPYFFLVLFALYFFVRYRETGGLTPVLAAALALLAAAPVRSSGLLLIAALLFILLTGRKLRPFLATLVFTAVLVLAVPVVTKAIFPNWPAQAITGEILFYNLYRGAFINYVQRKPGPNFLNADHGPFSKRLRDRIESSIVDEPPGQQAALREELLEARTHAAFYHIVNILKVDEQSAPKEEMLIGVSLEIWRAMPWQVLSLYGKFFLRYLFQPLYAPHKQAQASHYFAPLPDPVAPSRVYAQMAYSPVLSPEALAATEAMARKVMTATWMLTIPGLVLALPLLLVPFAGRPLLGLTYMFVGAHAALYAVMAGPWERYQMIAILLNVAINGILAAWVANGLRRRGRIN